MTANTRVLVTHSRWTDWDALAAEYGRTHRTRGNRVCHAFGIPLILLALLYWTRVAGPVPLAVAAWPIYLVWGRGLALRMAGLLAALTAVSLLLAPWAAWAAFAGGWLLQLGGHRFFEGKSPAFTRNLLHLFVGPAWLLTEGGHEKGAERPMPFRVKPRMLIV